MTANLQNVGVESPYQKMGITNDFDGLEGQVTTDDSNGNFGFWHQ